jgi:hypothetical protein
MKQVAIRAIHLLKAHVYVENRRELQDSSLSWQLACSQNKVNHQETRKGYLETALKRAAKSRSGNTWGDM